ncbi:hypothetical protein J2Z48_002643 [Croceifilum oryzae]|uniref:Uncharacterized protein n=1 Tax=Croceifilum oryzae TaxID=1553429 RepID=A0AAJ1WUZ3_9BACL|nr:hypothetical protein [Croceifilum oryzae]MDQ0418451.1 hypothetical protein [Croceifilum oryzae]
MKKIVSSLVAVSMLATAAIPVFASESTPVNQAQVNSMGQISEALKSKVEPYVKIENKQFKLVNEDKLRQKISSNDLATVKQSINLANEGIKTVPMTRVEGNAIVAPRGGISVLSIEGKTDYELHWWGWQVWLSQSVVRGIAELGWAGVGGTAGLIFKSIGAAFAAGLMAKAIEKFGVGNLPALYVEGTWLSIKEMTIKKQT